MRTMAKAQKHPNDAPALIEIKAVDTRYPLFGRVALASGREFSPALAVRDGLPGLLADAQLLARLQVRVGDVVRIGQQDFRISCELRREPDRASAGFSFGPRVLMRLDGLRATGLLQPGAIVRYVYKLRLGGAQANAPLAEVLRVKARLQERLDPKGVRVRDYTEAGTRLKEFLDTLAMYLTLVGLLSLLVGGVGVANGVQGYLEGKTGNIATLKSLGATRRTIMAVYLAQTLFLAALGCLAGCALGLGVSFALGDVLLAKLGLASAHVGRGGVLAAVSFQSLAVASAYGVLTTLVFTLRPLAGACAISPARLFRGYADPMPRAAFLETACLDRAACGRASGHRPVDQYAQGRGPGLRRGRGRGHWAVFAAFLGRNAPCGPFAPPAQPAFAPGHSQPAPSGRAYAGGGLFAGARAHCPGRCGAH